MLKIVYCVKKKQGLSDEDFSHYWLTKHGPLVHSVSKELNILRYVQSHTVNRDVAVGAAQQRNMKTGYDGITEAWFESIETLNAPRKTKAGRDAARILYKDEATFIDHENSAFFFTEEHKIFSTIDCYD